MSIKRDNSRRVFVLEVKGLPIRYYSGPPPSTMATHIDSLSQIAFTDVKAITNVSSYQAELDPSGGIASYSAVTVSLAIDKKRGDSNSPHVIFERCGLRSNVVKAKLQENYNHDDPDSFFLNVDSDLSSLSYPRLMHIGAETVKAVAFLSSNIILAERGVANTPIQSHILQNEGISTPEIATEITTFRGRKASLWVAEEYKDGSVSSYTELINGFIESSPVGDGKTITINILPLIAMIDSNILPRPTETTLLHGYHYFDADRGNTLEYMVLNKRALRVDTAIVNSTQNVNMTDNGLEFSDFFDISMTNTQGEKLYYHPRHASFFRFDESVFAETYTDPNSNSKDQGFTYDATIGEIQAVSTNSTIIATGNRREIKRIEIGSDEVKQWPLGLRDAISNNIPTGITGTGGAWGYFTLNPQGDNHVLNVTTLVDENLGCVIELWTDTDTYRTTISGEFDPTVIDGMFWGGGGGYPEWHIPDQERLWYGFDFQSVDSEDYPQEPLLPQEFNRSARSTGRGGYSRYENGNSKNSSSSFRVRGHALGYYQLFEKSILVRDNLGLPSSAGSSVFPLQVEYYERASGEMKTQTFRATHQSSVSYDGSNIGYRIHIKQDFNNENRSFGDWPNQPYTKISLADSYSSLSANEVLLRLLQNGGGSQVNGEYDLGTVGLNIPASDIDLPSFEQFTNLSGISSFEGDVDNSVNLRDVIDPILKSMGAAMVMKRDSTGKSKISLVPIGLEQVSRSGGSFTDTSHIHSSPSPLSLVYEDVITAIEFKIDYQDGDYQQTVLINNGEAIARYNEEQRQMTIELRGVRSDDLGSTYQEVINFFKPTFGRIFNLLSNPLRLWRFSVGTGPSIDTDLGSYYQITSDHLKGYGDTYGVSSAMGMVRSINQQLMGEGAEIEVIHIDAKAVGWNDSAVVSTVVSTTEIDVTANVYSLYDQQGESTVDASWFNVGDSVLYYPKADQGNTTSLTISQIDGNRLTFSSSHGISTTGGIISANIASSATSSQLSESCYMANSSTGLLNGSLPPQEYV